MRADELPSDDELTRLIVARFGQAIGAGAEPYVVADVNFGTRPESPARRPALFAVNDLRMEGLTITDALRRIYADHDLLKVANLTFGSFKRSYEEFRHKELLDHFYACILDGDLDDAMCALRCCHDSERRLIWEDLNRDSPPRTAP